MPEVPEELTQRLDHVNRLLTTQRTLAGQLQAVAEIIERTSPPVDAVSIALVVQDGVATGAASSQLAVEADLVQYGYNQGPCLLAVRENRPVRIEVMAQDERFEHFAPGAIEAGVESSLSWPLRWQGEVVGSINLYSRTPGALSGDIGVDLDAIGSYAAQAIGTSPLRVAALELVEGLATTVADADAVQTAVGLLLGRGAADEGSALAELQRRAEDQGCSPAEAAWRMLADHASGLDDGDGAGDGS